MTWILKDDNGGRRELDTRAEAEDAKDDLEDLGATVELRKKSNGNGESERAGGNSNNSDTDVIGPKAADEHPDEKPSVDTAEALDKLGDSIEEDPLSVLPRYMITKVDGKPSLNKRGVSVLAYHYDIDVIEREVVAYPHDHDYETAVVEIMVEGGDGRTFSGIGEAHADETPKHQLLRMAETRAYKRAVIFATGTGIVSYQEMTGQLGGDQ